MTPSAAELAALVKDLEALCAPPKPIDVPPMGMIVSGTTITPDYSKLPAAIYNRAKTTLESLAAERVRLDSALRQHNAWVTEILDGTEWVSIQDWLDANPRLALSLAATEHNFDMEFQRAEAAEARCAELEAILIMTGEPAKKAAERITALEAERDRLRAALEAIEAGYGLDAMPISTYTMQQIASAALRRRRRDR